MNRRFRVLFVCTHNAARSQMAEAVLRTRAGDRFEAASAGSAPAERAHPLALRAIEEIGGDPGVHRPKTVDAVYGEPWDLVVTVCDDAREACPVPPVGALVAHWGVADPSRTIGSEEERAEAFRATRERLARRIERFLALDPERRDRDDLARALADLEAEPT